MWLVSPTPSPEPCSSPRSPVIVVGYSHGIYIDESGSADTRNDSVTSLWTSAAVAVPFEHTTTLSTGVQHIVAKHFRPGVREIKGSGTPGTLRRASTLDSVSAALVELLDDSAASVWVTGSQRGVGPMPDRARDVLLERPKDIARHLLFERINGYLEAKPHGNDKWLLIWDISEQQELEDFSRFVANFHDRYSRKRRHPRLANALLGGCSHDWGGLQVADWFAHMGLHYCGGSEGRDSARRLVREAKKDARQDKAETFGNTLWNALQGVGGTIRGVGFRTW